MRLVPMSTAFILCATSAMSAVIDFEGQLLDGQSQVSPAFSETDPYTEDGYQLTDPTGFTGIFSPGAAAHTNGSDVLGFSVGSGFTLSAIAGRAFDLLSFQSGNLDPATSSPGQVELTGAFAGGGTITETFEHGEINEFQTFNTDGFTDLLSVTFFTTGSSTGAAIDNINVGPVSAVPVPAALPLLLSALGGLALVRRRASRG